MKTYCLFSKNLTDNTNSRTVNDKNRVMMKSV